MAFAGSDAGAALFEPDPSAPPPEFRPFKSFLNLLLERADKAPTAEFASSWRYARPHPLAKTSHTSVKEVSE